MHITDSEKEKMADSPIIGPNDIKGLVWLSQSYLQARWPFFFGRRGDPIAARHRSMKGFLYKQELVGLSE